jgi:hypothetical protein
VMHFLDNYCRWNFPYLLQETFENLWKMS